MIKAGETTHRIPTIFFLLLNGLSILLLIGLLLTPDWVEMKDEEQEIEFVGGLFKINEGMSSGESYSDLSDKWCSKESENTEEYYMNHAGCTLFTDLTLAGAVVFAIEIILILLNILTLAFLYVLIKHRGRKVAIIASSLISLCLQVFAFIIYFYLVNLTFDSSCDSWNAGHDPDSLCPKDGPTFFLAILIYESFLFMAQIAVFCYHFKKKTTEKKVVPGKLTQSDEDRGANRVIEIRPLNIEAWQEKPEE